MVPAAWYASGTTLLNRPARALSQSRIPTDKTLGIARMDQKKAQRTSSKLASMPINLSCLFASFHRRQAMVDLLVHYYLSNYLLKITFFVKKSVALTFRLSCAEQFLSNFAIFNRWMAFVLLFICLHFLPVPSVFLLEWFCLASFALQKM